MVTAPRQLTIDIMVTAWWQLIIEIMVTAWWQLMIQIMVTAWWQLTIQIMVTAWWQLAIEIMVRQLTTEIMEGARPPRGTPGGIAADQRARSSSDTSYRSTSLRRRQRAGPLFDELINEGAVFQAQVYVGTADLYATGATAATRGPVPRVANA